MVENKIFDNLDELNKFLNNNISIINIETKLINYNTGLPLPHGGSFISTKEVFNLFYIKKEN